MGHAAHQRANLILALSSAYLAQILLRDPDTPEHGAAVGIKLESRLVRERLDQIASHHEFRQDTV
ncbi:hypothetical protein V5F59_23675 [Xanthobacter autotrophicus DSM 431]|uniref:hypothetical protein n=1 Tax=Xanthobacter nonsaccharivorans TaxID=3119912 RepID=UPI00372AE0E0